MSSEEIKMNSDCNSPLYQAVKSLIVALEQFPKWTSVRNQSLSDIYLTAGFSRTSFPHLSAILSTMGLMEQEGERGGLRFKFVAEAKLAYVDPTVMIYTIMERIESFNKSAKDGIEIRLNNPRKSKNEKLIEELGGSNPIFLKDGKEVPSDKSSKLLNNSETQVMQKKIYTVTDKVYFIYNEQIQSGTVIGVTLNYIEKMGGVEYQVLLDCPVPIDDEDNPDLVLDKICVRYVYGSIQLLVQSLESKFKINAQIQAQNVKKVESNLQNCSEVKGSEGKFQKFRTV